MNKASLLEQAYETGVLDRVHHAALLRDADKWARQANIPAHFLYRSMKGVASEQEIDHLYGLNKHADNGVAGLLLVAMLPSHPVVDRFALFAAACLRNYIPARVVMLNDLLMELKEQGEPSERVLLIPDFAPYPTTLLPWQTSLISTMLYNRYAASQQTLLYVADMDHLRQTYSPLVTQLIEKHYVRVHE